MNPIVLEKRVCVNLPFFGITIVFSTYYFGVYRSWFSKKIFQKFVQTFYELSMKLLAETTVRNLRKKIIQVRAALQLLEVLSINLQGVLCADKKVWDDQTQ